uniref:Ion transport domain-containing protein n=1 Tax=Zooxanthella nutricula TaxID=1333877 RepID=A0A7S2QJN6_9DINO
MEKGADPNDVNGDGETALKLAVKKEFSEVAKCLAPVTNVACSTIAEVYAHPDVVAAAVLDAIQKDVGFNTFAALGPSPVTIIEDQSRTAECLLISDEWANEMLRQRMQFPWLTFRKKVLGFSNKAVQGFTIDAQGLPVCPEVLKAVAQPGAGDAALGHPVTKAIVEAAWEGIQWAYMADFAVAIAFVTLLTMATFDLHFGHTPAQWVIGLLAVIAAKAILEESQQNAMTIWDACLAAKNTMLRKYDITPAVAIAVSPLAACPIATKDKLLRLLRDLGILLWCGIPSLINVVVFQNGMDWMRIVFDTLGLCILAASELGERDRCVLAIWVVFRWLRVLNFLRGFPMFGPRMLPIFKAAKDTFNFFVVLVFFLVAFTHAYFVLGIRDDPPHAFVSAVFTVMRLGLFADFDLFHLEGTDVVFEEQGGTWEPRDPEPTTMYFVVMVYFCSVSLVGSVLLMNLLVGVLSSNYDRWEERSDGLFTQERARIIVMYDSRVWLRAWALCKRRRSVPWVTLPSQMQHHRGTLIFAMRKGEEADQLFSVRSFVASQLHVRQEETRKDIEETRKELAKLDAKLDKLLSAQVKCADQA